MFLSVPYMIWNVPTILNIITCRFVQLHLSNEKCMSTQWKKQGLTLVTFPCNKKKQGLILVTFPCKKKKAKVQLQWYSHATKKQGFTLMTFPCNKKARFHFDDIPMHYCVHNTLMEQCYLWWFIVIQKFHSSSIWSMLHP
jgi:glutathione peroxidase-family protein